jgi:hypothetical protein
VTPVPQTYLTLPLLLPDPLHPACSGCECLWGALRGALAPEAYLELVRAATGTAGGGAGTSPAGGTAPPDPGSSRDAVAAWYRNVGVALRQQRLASTEAPGAAAAGAGRASTPAPLVPAGSRASPAMSCTGPSEQRNGGQLCVGGAWQATPRNPEALEVALQPAAPTHGMPHICLMVD